MFKPRPAQQEESVITPTEKYFLKIREGVSDLSKYELKALAYVKNLSSDTMTPPDRYFLALASYNRDTPNRNGGIIGWSNSKKLLDHHAAEAEAYVNEKFPSPSTGLCLVM